MKFTRRYTVVVQDFNTIESKYDGTSKEAAQTVFEGLISENKWDVIEFLKYKMEISPSTLISRWRKV